MKFAKKLFALLMATLMMVGLLSTTAMADGYTITIKNSAPNHVYHAYQVFIGDLNSAGVLSNVAWGDGVNPTNLLTALKANSAFNKQDGGNTVNMFSSATNAKDVAQTITGWPYNEALIKAFADTVAAVVTADNSVTHYTSGAQSGGKYSIAVPKAGYYFIMDAGTLGAEGATDYLLKITNNIEITPKASAPTFDKTVNTSLDGTYSKAIDAQVGDKVWIKMEATLPSLLNDYKQFHVKFEDFLPAGLAPVTNSSNGNIYILHANNTTTPLSTREVSVTAVSGGNEITLDLGDVKTQLTGVKLNLNDKIVIKYAATVTNQAVFGLNGDLGLGNKINSTFTFSSDMNQAAPANAADLKTATLDSSASVYVYQAEFTKVDSVSKEVLPNAKFVLFRNVETGTASGPEKQYATATITAVDVNGNIVNINAPEAVHCVYTITEWTTDEASATEVFSGSDGKFVIQGVDALAYHLDETQAPSGYNDMEEDVLITIASEITGQTLSALNMTTDGVKRDSNAEQLKVGLVTGEINNTAGTVLPTTGGMGTTIFYIVGGVLVMGAAAAFVMKRRNEA